MNKVITINLSGIAYQLEEAGYDALRAYLQDGAARLQNNPDRDEILSDIERAIGEKFRALLGSHKTVIETHEVAEVISQMGPIEAGSDQRAAGSGASGPSNTTGGPSPAAPPRITTQGDPPKRLYRIHEGAMFAGVCNGIAAYINIDPTFVRLGFVFLTLLWGAGVLFYIIMAIVVPEAVTPEEKSAASGTPFTAQEFIRRAKEGYYQAMRSFPDRQARREWRRRFRREVRGWRWCFAGRSYPDPEHPYHWPAGWWPSRPLPPGMGFAVPFLSLLQGAALLLLLCSLISLLNTSAIFGVALPSKLPVWVAAVLLLLVYGLLVEPLKLARRMCYWGVGHPTWASPFIFLLDALVWLAIACTVLWLAFHFFPDLHQAIDNIPTLLHHARDDIQSWWKG